MDKFTLTPCVRSPLKLSYCGEAQNLTRRAKLTQVKQKRNVSYGGCFLCKRLKATDFLIVKTEIQQAERLKGNRDGLVSLR